MNSRWFPFPLFRLLWPFLLLILVNSLASHAYDDWFLNCNDLLTCESIPGKEFPLWRNSGTQICGYPESMKVNCEGRHATIEILRAKYQLLGFSKNYEILIIAEIGFSDPFCPPKHNISSSSIYAMIPVSYPGTKLPSNCKLSAVVPISHLLKELDDLKKVAHQIGEMFDHELKVDAQICRSCSVPDGFCGYDLLSKQTRCYCQSQSPSESFEVCHSPPNAEAPKTAAVPAPVQRRVRRSAEAREFSEIIQQIDLAHRFGPDLVKQEHLLSIGLARPRPAMAPRSIFGERKKGKKAANEAGSSRPDVTIVTEDESDIPFAAPRSSTAGLRRSSRNRRPPTPSATGGREFGVPVFELPDGYSGTGSEVDALTQDFICWQGLQSHQPDGEIGFNDPARGILVAQRQLREVFSLVTASSISLANKISDLQRHNVPRRELAQAQESLDRANRLLVEVKADLELNRAELSRTKVQLAEAKAHLADANYLAEAYKRTDEYINMQNEIWTDGAKWALKRVKKHDTTFDPSVVRGEISGMRTDPDAYPVSDSSSSGRDDMEIPPGDNDH